MEGRRAESRRKSRLRGLRTRGGLKSQAPTSYGTGNWAGRHRWVERAAMWLPGSPGSGRQTEERRRGGKRRSSDVMLAHICAAGSATGCSWSLWLGGGAVGALELPRWSPMATRCRDRGAGEGSRVSNARVRPFCQAAGHLPASPRPEEGHEHSQCRWGHVQARAVNTSSL